MEDLGWFVNIGGKVVNIARATVILDKGKGQEMAIYFGAYRKDEGLKFTPTEADALREWFDVHGKPEQII